MTDAGSILVVDDESEALAFLTGILAAEGYHVRSADSGQLALASVAACPPQLILLDLHMPDIDGLEVCRRLKVRDEARNIPLMFMSAAGETEERLKGLALGAVDYVTKPFQREELLARVRTHIELDLLRTQLERQASQGTVERGTARKRLRESEERFRNMADTAPVMIWISGTDKLCTFFNQPWLTFTGRTKEEEMGDGWAKGVHPDDLDRCFSIYSTSFDGRQNFQMEYRLRRADGEFRWVLDKGAPYWSPDGIFAGYIGSAVDITDLKRIQESDLAKAKLESLRAFTRGIAHDFNNMMGGIVAQAELAANHLEEGSPPGEEIYQVKAIALRASEVVRELMVYSGQERVDFEPVDLSRLVEEMFDLLKISISKQAVLQADLGKNLPAVRGNATQIRQVVMNLIINASEAIGEQGGAIHLRTSLVGEGQDGIPNPGAGTPNECVRLEITDNGCGMTNEQRIKIFDPFFTTKPGGHGLGLAAVQGIVQSHGGAINVRSTPQFGTTFEVLLPCARECDESVPSNVRAARTQESTAAFGTVLFVEDEEALRQATAAALRKRGYCVFTADHGQAAMEIFRARAQEIAAVLLDLTLPGISGLDVLRRMRGIKPDVRVILTSAYEPEIADSDASGQRPARFLRKPYTFSDLRRELEEAFSQDPRADGASVP